MFGKIVIAATAFAAVANGAACPDSEFTRLLPVASDPNVNPCAKASGFNLIPPSGLPTDAQLKIMCVTDACKGVIKAVQATNPTNCDLTVGTVTLNVYSLVNNFDNDCKRVNGTPAPAPSPTTSAPAPGPAPGPSPTTAAPGPAPTTVAPTPGKTTAAPSPVDNSC